MIAIIKWKHLFKPPCRFKTESHDKNSGPVLNRNASVYKTVRTRTRLKVPNVRIRPNLENLTTRSSLLALSHATKCIKQIVNPIDSHCGFRPHFDGLGVNLRMSFNINFFHVNRSSLFKNQKYVCVSWVHHDSGVDEYMGYNHER